MKLEVLYEDNHLIAVNKPAGMVIQENEPGMESLQAAVKEYIKKKYNKPGAVFLGVIHRLDTVVTGVVLFAKTSKALTRMNEQFKSRDINKVYVALVRRKPNPLSDTLVHYITKDQKQNKAILYNKEKVGAKRAELSYQYIATANHCFLLRIKLKTGRPHQIRIQLAKTITPIVGDVKYGQTKPNSDKSIYLHALGLNFIHPVTKEHITLHAPLPNYGNWKFFKDIEQNILEE